jgi:hypothetical protein
MAKASEAGRTKTRLVPPLRPDEAAACNTAFLRDVSANLQAAARAAASQGYAIGGYMAFGPPGTEGFFRETLPHEIGLIQISATACSPPSKGSLPPATPPPSS